MGSSAGPRGHKGPSLGPQLPRRPWEDIKCEQAPTVTGAGMTYGRILLIAALIFGALYYYHSNELAWEQQAYEHQENLRVAAQRDRDAVWEHEKKLREEAERKRPAGG